MEKDAAAFVKAAGITSGKQKRAINNLVMALKKTTLSGNPAKSIWSAMDVIYPFVGGNATAHSFNLKNPSAYQISWFGGMTHGSGGAIGNGSNSYGNTGFNPKTNGVNFGLNSASLGLYVNAHLNANGMDIQTYDGSGGKQVSLDRTSTPAVTFAINSYGGSALNVSALFGLFCASRQSASSQSAYFNGSNVGTNNNTVSDTTQFPVVLGAANIGGSISNSSSSQFAFAFFGAGMSDTDMANLYTIISNYQTYLGRA